MYRALNNSSNTLRLTPGRGAVVRDGVMFGVPGGDVREPVQGVSKKVCAGKAWICDLKSVGVGPEDHLDGIRAAAAFGDRMPTDADRIELGNAGAVPDEHSNAMSRE